MSWKAFAFAVAATPIDCPFTSLWIGIGSSIATPLGEAARTIVWPVNASAIPWASRRSLNFRSALQRYYLRASTYTLTTYLRSLLRYIPVRAYLHICLLRACSIPPIAQIFCRVGLIGQLEVKRNERLSSLVSGMQAYVRWYFERIRLDKLQAEQWVFSRAYFADR